MMTTAIKARKRSVAKEVASPITAEMHQLAVQFHLNNAKANAAARAAEEAREALYKLMKDAGVSEFKTQTTTENGPIALDAKLKTTKRSAIDVSALLKLVSSETFMKCVSATKAAVVDFAGTDVATRCSIEKLGTENVSVTPAKG
jgi:heme-binding NEAT domain protein